MQGYKQLLEECDALSRVNVGQHAGQWQATLIMVLPESIQMEALPHGNKHNLSYKLGVGFARLACQVIAWYFDMQSIWLLDDNIHGCWKLDYQNVLQQRGQAVQHPGLLPISVVDMMLTIEQQVGS